MAGAAAAPEWSAEEAGAAPPPLPPPGALTFFTHTCCPYAERVWLALLEKQVGGRW